VSGWLMTLRSPVDRETARIYWQANPNLLMAEDR
jgi:hypothetical protein